MYIGVKIIKLFIEKILLKNKKEEISKVFFKKYFFSTKFIKVLKKIIKRFIGLLFYNC